MSATQSAPMASSPPSSGGTVYHDTPSTIPTTVSPETTGTSETRVKTKVKTTTDIALPSFGRIGKPAAGSA